MKKFTKRLLVLSLAFVLLFSGCAAPGAEVGKDTPDSPDTSGETAVTQETVEENIVVTPSAFDGGAKKSFRIFPYYWLEDDAFEATCAGLLEYGDVIDEIALFCDQMNNPYMPDDMLSEWTAILTKRIAKLRELGFSNVGINMLCTVGHGDYAVTTLPSLPMTTAMDYEGNTAAQQPCPRTDDFKEYVMHKYAEYAKCGPDFIWVDDDFRVPDKTVCYICFCNSCMKRFNSENGTNYTRDSLAALLNDDGTDNEEVQTARRLWSQYLLDSYIDIMGYIREAVESVDPDIKLGLMTVHLPANEYILSDYSGMLEALGADKARPGGGFHNESYPAEMITKNIGVALQNTQLTGVADRQYEFEDFPQTSNKSAKTHVSECTAAIMAGCNGLAFASMPTTNNDDVMDALRSHTEMWNDMVKVGDTWTLYGANALFDEEYGVYCSAGRYFDVAAHGFFNQELGYFTYGMMPYTPYKQNSCLTIVTEDMLNPLTDAEIEEMLSGGVIMDGGAARLLIARGYDYLVGASRASWSSSQINEKYTSNPLNGKAAGTIRYMYGVGFYNFKLLDGAEPLGISQNALFEEGATCSFSFENELGGRVVVYGYTPWEYYGTWQRMEQTRNIVEWASKGQMPVTVLNEERIVPWIKEPADRSQFMLLLTNATIDDTVDEIEVKVLGEYNCDFTYYDEDGVKSTIPASQATVADGYTTIKLPGMTGWGFCVLYTQA